MRDTPGRAGRASRRAGRDGRGAGDNGSTTARAFSRVPRMRSTTGLLRAPRGRGAPDDVPALRGAGPVLPAQRGRRHLSRTRHTSETREAMTILHGTCLLNGKHAPGSALALECPVLNAERRSEARKRGWHTRKENGGATPGPDTREGVGTGEPNPASDPGAISATSETVFRRVGTGRAGKPGRPRVPRAEQLRRRRERDRAPGPKAVPRALPPGAVLL
jgi:hypothetical protein